MSNHDTRCEQAWNDGLCSCEERVENARHGFWAHHDDRSLLRRLAADRLLPLLRSTTGA